MTTPSAPTRPAPGIAMHRSAWTPGKLEKTVLSLLDEHAAMHQRLMDIAKHMKADPGTSRAATAVLEAIRSNGKRG